MGFKSFAPHVRASDELTKRRNVFLKLATARLSGDGCAVQARGGLSARLPATAAGGDSSAAVTLWSTAKIERYGV